MLKRMKFGLLWISVMQLSLWPDNILCDSDKQAKVFSSNGDLILESAYDRNITLRLIGDSSLLLNNVNIMEKLNHRLKPEVDDGEAKQNDIFSIDEIKTEIQGLRDDLERFANRLMTMQNRSRRTLQLEVIRRNLGRINRINGRLLALERRLKRDECAEAAEPCKNGGTCYDSYNGFFCDCTEGYTGETCEDDLDECYLLSGTDFGCQNNAVCVNTPGSYRCICNKGFSGTHCRLRNAICQQDEFQELCAHGICVPANNKQGYTCICDQGWRRSTFTSSNSSALPSLACDVDVNECDESRNPCHSECINLPGSFTCGPCAPGYTGNGVICLDIDECATNNGGCSTLPKVRCINTEGSYFCANCPHGWIGDGHSCDKAPSNSCNAENICHPQANCEYISDVASCTCPPGMFGHGFGPRGCHTSPITDSCANHICQNNGTCISNGRTTSCVCSNGYSGALCQIADGCHPNPCQNDGGCKPLGMNGFKCSCQPGTTGKHCEVLRSVCARNIRLAKGDLKYPSDNAAEYSINERCAWIIRTTPTQILNVTFSNFDVEESEDCTRDWLQVHDGSNLASQLIGRFCGKDLPLGGSILSSHHLLFFWFRSDNATNRAGFEMSWISQPAICGEKLDLSYKDSGIIKSPSYPGKMPINRECQWELTAPYGYRFNIRVYNILLGSLLNCTGDTLEINDAGVILKKYCQSSVPEVLRSSTNKISLHLHTDSFGVDSSFQLHYEVEPGLPHCGGIFTEPSGYIVGPSERATCLYLIQQPLGTQVKWEFVDFKSFDLLNCNFNRIEIFDGKTDESPKILISCGGKTPEPVVSTNNYMLVRYQNTLTDERKASNPIRAKYSRVCDYRVFGPDAGTLNTPNYPKPYVEYLTCTFHIYGPADTVVIANFTDFSIAEIIETGIEDSTDNVTSANSITEYHKLNDNSVTYVDIFLSATNKRRFVKGVPMVLRSEGNKMTVIFHATANIAKARGLHFEYSFAKIGCGGVYTDANGSLDKTINDENCLLIFEAPDGKYIKMDLKYIIFGRSAEFLIYANQTGGRDFLLKNATRSSQIQETFNFNIITVVLRNGIKVSGSYEFVSTAEACGGNFSTLYGALKSPSWPRPYPANLNCIWIIAAPLGNKIELQVHNFTLEPTCSGDILEIRNGRFPNSPLIGRYCGSQIPSRLVSLTNSLYIRFTTDNSIEGAGFYFNWEQAITGCGGKLTAYKGSIHAPHFNTLPETLIDHDPNMICEWKILVSQGSSIDLMVTTVTSDLEFCHKNNLKIYDGSSTLSALLSFNCSNIIKGENLQLQSSSNEVLIIYSLTENSKYVTPEFMLDYVTNCRILIDKHRGVIESPNFPENYPDNQNCAWDLKAGRNNKFILAFSHLNLEVSDGKCEHDYIEIWDMKDLDVLKKHHFCTYSPDTIVSEGNRLIVRFVTDYSNNKNGFRAEYNRLGCGEHMQTEYGYISSPNYPFSNDLDCDWFIEVRFGRQIVLMVTDFHIESEHPDCTENILYFKESKNSSIELAKECREQQTALVVTSPGNRLYVHFRTSPTRSRKYFKASYYTRQAACGGDLQGISGLITSSNYPYSPNTQSYNCIWHISVPDSYGLLLKFKHFNLTDSQNCTEASMEFFKIEDNSYHPVGRFCGSEKPNIKLIHGNKLQIKFNDSGKRYLGTFAIEYQKQCGGLITRSSGYINSLATEECIWEFDVVQGTLISLTILKMDCYCQKNKDSVKICKNGLGFKENQFDNNLQSGNYTMYLCEQHQTDLVFEASLLHIFANNINFKAKFSTTQHSCGGTIETSQGSLASPYYPSAYPSDIDCNWILQGSKGSFLQLQFDELDIVSSENCNEDYLEIRTWSEGTILGIFCGSKIPQEPLVSYERVWLRFHSADSNTAKGFKLSWNYAHMNELVNMTKGYIANPPLKMVQNDEEPYAWRIIIPRGQFIQLNFEEYNNGLKLFDGYDDTALPVDIPPSPWRFVSSSNVVYLQTNNENIEKVVVLWSITDMKPITRNATLSGCHSEEFIKVHRFNSIRVTSPGYPKGYENNLQCEWIFKAANSIEHVAVALVDVDLEVTDLCSSDYLKISTSADLLSWHKQEQLCNGSDVSKRRKKMPFLWIYGTPHIKLDFVTDRSVSRTGFLAKVLAKCGSNMTDSIGFIDGRMFNDFHDGPNSQCIWHIDVKPGKRIRVQLDYSSVGDSNDYIDEKCSVNALLYDGVDDHAPLIIPGKLCFPQNVTTIVVNSTSNHLTIKYNLNFDDVSSAFTNLKFWNLTYREYSECNEEIRLIPEASDIVITSPFYPNVPHPHTECEWRVIAPPGELLQIEFMDRFDMNARYCNEEYLELFDGYTSLARRLGHYCRKPPMIRTTQNMLYLHYLTDIAEPRNGFKASVSISRCGGIFTENYGTITSPGYPEPYSSNAQCDFVINLKGISAIRLNIVDINLPYNETKPESSDHLEIMTITSSNGTIPSIFVFGNITEQSEFQIISNKIIVRFHTFSKSFNYRGFLLKYFSVGPYCVHSVTGISGYITMNLAAKPLYQSTCIWKITVPKGQRVRLEFLNMEDLKQYNFTNPLRFNIYNNFESTSEITAFNPNTFNAQSVIESSDNLMYLKITIPRSDLTLRPLRAHYSSDNESPCPNDIISSNDSGFVDIPGSDPVFKRNFYCAIKIKLNEGETIVFNISTLRLSDERAPAWPYPLVFKSNFMSSNYRTNLTQYIYAQSHKAGSIAITQTNRTRITSLKMAYQKYACGGVINAASGIQIKYPQLNTIDIGEKIFCAWFLYKSYASSRDNKGKDFRLRGNFSFTDSCDDEYIEIFEGQWMNRSSSLKICKDNLMDSMEYLLVKRYTFIIYNSAHYNAEKSSFSLSIVKNLTCSSETLVNLGTYPVKIDKSSYTNNQECSWVFYTKSGLYLQVGFMGRFFIEDSSNCTKDYLEIQQDREGIWIPEARFCGRESPPLFNSTLRRIRIIFRTDDAITADGFELFVQAHCWLTVHVTSTEPQQIISSQTNAMDWRKMHCEFIFYSNETNKLIVVTAKFDTKATLAFPLQPCRMGTLTITKMAENGTELPGVQHCEQEVIGKAYRYLRFTYDAYVTQKFTLEYAYDSCGGNFTAPAVIRPLKNEIGNSYADNMNCIWYITAPPEYSIAVRFKYFSTEKGYDYVTIYSGFAMETAELVSKLSGNYSSIPPIVVESNRVVINAISDSSASGDGFEAKISFLVNCNERISLTEGNSPLTLTRNVKFNSSQEYICNYRITAPKFYRIRVEIKKLQINTVNSTCLTSNTNCENSCNLLEIFGDRTTFEAIPVKFCSPSISNRIYISPAEFALLKFTAKRPGQYSFEISLKMENTDCGATEYNLRDNEKLKFLFPLNGLAKYAPNTHCTWRFSASDELEFQFSYIDLQNKSQITGECVDYITVTDVYHRNQFCGHFENFSTNALSTTSNEIEILFHTDESEEGKGFEFVAQSIDACNRTYNGLSKSIIYRKIEWESVVCNDTIFVPEDYTLNIYIYTMYFKNYNCSRLHLKITDLKTNQTLLDRCQNTYSNINLFTTTNAVRVEASDFTTIAFTYAASNRSLTPGCGGTFRVHKAQFSSPPYEDSRNFSECRWDIIVPSTNVKTFIFYEFNMGTVTNCHLDNVKVIEVLPNKREKLLKTLCGPDMPQPILSSSAHLAIVSKKSPNFDGTGWTLSYDSSNYSWNQRK